MAATVEEMESVKNSAWMLLVALRDKLRNAINEKTGEDMFEVLPVEFTVLEIGLCLKAVKRTVGDS